MCLPFPLLYLANGFVTFTEDLGTCSYFEGRQCKRNIIEILQTADK